MDTDHEAKPQAGLHVWSWAGLECNPQSLSAGDAPWSGTCAVCCRWIVKPTISEPWHHRADGEPLPDGPASQEWGDPA